MERRLIRAIDRGIDRALILLFIILLLIGIWFCYDLWYVAYRSNDESLLAYKPQGTTITLGDLGKDAVAWITIDDTNIDYPIMQGTDNMVYLNKDPYGHFSLSGSIFLDSRNNRYFHDDYSLTYGHHMEHGLMFGALDKFEEPDYFKKHRSGTLTTRKEQFDVKIFASIKTDAKVDIVFEPTQSSRDGLISYLKDNATVYEEPADGNIIGLSTCADPATTDRWVVYGTLHKTGNVKDKSGKTQKK